MNIVSLTHELDKLYKLPFREMYTGLVLHGQKNEVSKILLVHDISLLYNKEIEADLIIAHHPAFGGLTLNQLRDRQVAVYAAHLGMDSHPKIGHNKLILDMLGRSFGAGSYERFGRVLDNFDVGYSANLAKQVHAKELIKCLEDKLITTAAHTHLQHGQYCKKVATCSGDLPGELLWECMNKGVDTIVVGSSTIAETLSKTPEQRGISGIELYSHIKVNMLCFGHEQTELPGLYALKEYITKLGFRGQIDVRREAAIPTNRVGRA